MQSTWIEKRFRLVLRRKEVYNRGIKGVIIMSENNRPNAVENVEAIRYPIILHQNNSISAKPPYKVLRYESGVYMQLIDLNCAKFNSPSVSGGAYSIALFKIREEEALLAQTKPERLDFLANMLYEHIPADRFVRASVIRENKPIDIKVNTECRTIDSAAATRSEAEESKVNAAQMPVKDIGRLNLNIKADVLSDEQRERYVFEPLRTGKYLAKADIEGLSLTEIVSAAFVTSRCNVARISRAGVAARDENFKFLLGAIAENLRENAFYAICEKESKAYVRLFNNGVPFTPVFSEKALAEGVIGENENVECVEIADRKAEFFRALDSSGVVQLIVDENPLTLSIKGFARYMDK